MFHEYGLRKRVRTHTIEEKSEYGDILRIICAFEVVANPFPYIHERMKTYAFIESRPNI